MYNDCPPILSNTLQLLILIYCKADKSMIMNIIGIVFCKTAYIMFKSDLPIVNATYLKYNAVPTRKHIMLIIRLFLYHCLYSIFSTIQRSTTPCASICKAYPLPKGIKDTTFCHISLISYAALEYIVVPIYKMDKIIRGIFTAVPLL